MSSEVRPEVTGFDSNLGFTITHADGDLVTGWVDVDPSHQQPYGIVHGGLYCSVVETAASVGAARWFEDRGQVVGVSNHTNFLRATREGRLAVRAGPLKQGRTQQLWSVRISDDKERLVATGEVRLVNITTSDVLGGPDGSPETS